MQELYLKEDHPLLLNLSFSLSLGLLPVTLSLRTAGCGIKSSTGDVEQSSKCYMTYFSCYLKSSIWCVIWPISRPKVQGQDIASKCAFSDWLAWWWLWSFLIKLIHEESFMHVWVEGELMLHKFLRISFWWPFQKLKRPTEKWRCSLKWALRFTVMLML